jgi:hypothetical protein
MENEIRRYVRVNRQGQVIGSEYFDYASAWRDARPRNQRVDERVYKLASQTVKVDFSHDGPENVLVTEVSTGEGGVRKEREYFRPVGESNPLPVAHSFTHDGDVNELLANEPVEAN